MGDKTPREAALDAYSWEKVRDRYDADLLMAGFIDGANWQRNQEGS